MFSRGDSLLPSLCADGRSLLIGLGTVFVFSTAAAAAASSPANVGGSSSSGGGWQMEVRREWSPIGFAAAIAAYPVCDTAGDWLGDAAEVARDKVMVGIGLTPPARR